MSIKPVYGIHTYQTACGRFHIVKQTAAGNSRAVGSWRIVPMVIGTVAGKTALIISQLGLDKASFHTRREALDILQSLQDEGTFDV